MSDVEMVATLVVNTAVRVSMIAVMSNDLLGRVSTGADRITVISNDLAVTSLVLEQLGKLMRSKLLDGELSTFNKLGLQTLTASVDLCNDIFHALLSKIEDANEQLRCIDPPSDGKVALSTDGMREWPFLQPSIEIMKVDLLRAKATIMLFHQLHRLVDLKNFAKRPVRPAIPYNGRAQDVIASLLATQKEWQATIPPIVDIEPSLDDTVDTEIGNKTSSSDATKAKSDKVVQDGAESIVSEETLNAVPSNSKPVPKDGSVDEPIIIRRVRRDSRSSFSGSNSIMAEKSSPGCWSWAMLRNLRFFRRNAYSESRFSSEWDLSNHDSGLLRLYILKPYARATTFGFTCEFNLFEHAMAQDEIEEEVARSKRKSRSSVMKQLEALMPENNYRVERLVEGLPPGTILVSVKATKTELKSYGMTVRDVPNIRVIVKLGSMPPRIERDRDRSLVDLSKRVSGMPTFIKVHRKYMSPDTLDAYNLPWEWDEFNSNYIIIKQWVSEADQDILFEHSRELRATKKPKTPRQAPLGVRRPKALVVDENTTRGPDFSSGANHIDKPKEKVVNDLLSKYTTLYGEGLEQSAAPM